MENLGKTVKELRNLKGYSQRKLADLADISKSYLGNIETGSQDNIGSETLEKLAKALEYPFDIFMAKVLGVSNLGGAKIPIIGFANGRSTMNAVKIEDGLPTEPVIGEIDCFSAMQDKNSFAVIVKDDSMAPIRSDWICIVSSTIEVQTGDLVLYCKDNLMYLRILEKADRNSKFFITTNADRGVEEIENKDLQFLHHVWGTRSPDTY